ncbi:MULTISPECIES: thioesterase family protein [unclassified Paenibacillus]|uniref:acyl-CoA thioesterase n=1 Tax=unclassified Paenibacillus TaxID=185978 RepID=UPI001AE6135D|nr:MULTISPECIES: thioesterase family protein [unclassified Paenibacillus]MBP1154605.1 acyl-CoA thioester hydrolase [Paenibacillus sp. PvP091]MBP1170011.1 acyl-CoA thioester hydrolase [Paenibacillus sp. PvR098]MBP2441039.1 acyl-CoA thioester hydrolase [Paenibacillus sp. PvP052]
MRTFRHEIRVRYQETDQMGVVYHANYLNWFEIGRTEMIREMGMSYRTLEAKGLLLPVLEAELKFHQPARYDDSITILTRITEFSNLRIRFASEIHRDSDLLVSGGTRHVWLNREWKPVRIDKEAPDLYALIKEWS